MKTRFAALYSDGSLGVCSSSDNSLEIARKRLLGPSDVDEGTLIKAIAIRGHY